MIMNKGIALGKTIMAAMAEIFRTMRRNIAVELPRRNSIWDRGSASGPGFNAHKGKQAKALAKRRRLRDIAHDSRKYNQKRAKAA